MSSRPGEARSALRRMSKKFDTADGSNKRRQPATPGNVDAFMGVYSNSPTQPERYPGFMPGLILLWSERGRLHLGMARAHAQAVAVKLWRVAAGKASINEFAYDPALKQFSPSSLLVMALMRHVVNHDQVHEIDRLSNDTFKEARMNLHRQRVGMAAYNPHSLGSLWVATRQSLGHLARQTLPQWRQHQAIVA